MKLNNNTLDNVAPLYATLDLIVLSPGNIMWLDLSFNNISSIGTAFAKLPKLKRLYLHRCGAGSDLAVRGYPLRLPTHSHHHRRRRHTRALLCACAGALRALL